MLMKLLRGVFRKDGGGRPNRKDSSANLNGMEYQDKNKLISLVEYAIFRRSTDSLDIMQMAIIDSALQSARYYQMNMLTAKNLANDLEHLSFALANAPESGQILEFGVASGRTLNHIADVRRNQIIYGFDIFSGLPENWRTGFEMGMFRQTLPVVRDNCQLVVGLYDASLPKFIADHPINIALLHIDCDLYSSTKTILEQCRKYIKPGTVVVFDEYFNYPGFEQHEFRAWKEFTDRYSIAYKYIGFVSKHQQVSVIII